MRIAAKLAVIASVIFATVGVISITQRELTGMIVGGVGVLIGVALFLTNRDTNK